MRYFIVKYVKRPDGKIDEIVSTNKSLKSYDVMSANIILDFKNKSIEKCHYKNAPQINRDWSFLVEYYSKYYKNIIDMLEQTAA